MLKIEAQASIRFAYIQKCEVSPSQLLMQSKNKGDDCFIYFVKKKKKKKEKKDA